jgi:uncharacterized protein YcbX
MRSSFQDVRVGRIVGLWRYPVKSMAAEALPEVEVSWHGLAGDRRWAFVRENVVESGFPWLTLRDRNDMNRYRPQFVDPLRPDTSATQVATPSGALLDVTDPALARELAPGGARLIRQARGIFDTFPLSLVTTQSIAHLSWKVGTALDVQRFRPNFLVEMEDDAPFAEDSWVGSTLRIGGNGGMGEPGGMRLRLDKRDGRCLVITLDPATAERDPAILRTVARDHENGFGVYGTTVRPGPVAVGDAVFLERAD